MTQLIEGQLEIDHEHGVIYFHGIKEARTILRICSLPKPIPEIKTIEDYLDITHMHGVNWKGK